MASGTSLKRYLSNLFATLILFVQTTGVTFGDACCCAVGDVDAVVFKNLLSHLGKGKVSAKIGDGSL